ncbi:MAG: hypothetical protein Q4D02_08550, partial [Clostridia bacterium]|nr:hypothetical protein [Clostridia bacterium]
MKQGEKKKAINISKQKVKRKRQTSIITVFLWLFLIVTMITITATSMKNKNALEVEDNSWNITLVMYDKSGDTPNDAITDVTWNATRESDTKQLVMQTNYACTTGKAYQPGEIAIEIPGIAKDSFSEYWRNATIPSYSSNKTYSYWLENNIVIAADKDTDTVKQYDWSYSYNETTNTYTFTNNMEIAENEHFEGTIQITYNLLPRFRIQTDLGFQAKIKENISNQEEIIAMNSNICNFHYTSIKKTYTLSQRAQAGAKADYTKIEDILDDYYWVKYEFMGECSNKNVIYAYGENNVKLGEHERNCIKEELPEGCVLYDKNLNKIEPVEGNTYYYLVSSFSNSLVGYYIGYPKNKYNEGDVITNTAELWGRYEDEEEMQKLAEASRTVSLVDFDFEYHGKLYWIVKDGDSSPHYKNEIKNDGEGMRWIIEEHSFYTDSIMDVEIGDDLLYITRGNGEVTKLEDDEYNFTELKIPIFYTYNKYSGTNGSALIGYNYDLQVRYAGTNEYVSYITGLTSNREKTITFDREDIVGIKLVIKDLDKTLYYGHIYTYTNIHTSDCEIGYVYNFDYLQVYKKDENGNRTLVNEPTLDSYTTLSTLKIAEYDQTTYGMYMQRSTDKIQIIDGKVELAIRKTTKKQINNNLEKRYEITYQLENQVDISCCEVNKECIIQAYDILPMGMNLVSSREEIIESITCDFPYQNLKLKDGTTFSTQVGLENYIKENTAVTIDYNYKDSGRTKINITYDLNGIDWSYYLLNRSSFNDISSYICVEIPYDSMLDYGTTYKNYAYTMWNNQEFSYKTPVGTNPGGTTYDNGRYDSLASDIDNDGITDETLVYNLNTLNITHAVSSQQAVIKQVRTDLTKGAFVEGTAEATAGSEYTYKLRVTTGANSLKDLILYDTLETIYDESGNDISSGWKGEFVGVDTTYAEDKGYAPVVYYSEEQNPGKLTEVPDKWKVLDE